MRADERRRSTFRWRAQLAEADGRLFGDEEVVERHVGTGEFRGLEFLHVDARRMLNEVPSGPFGFRWTVNAYRGCSHACTYCFARPTHRYLGLGMGEDFDRKIVVKVNAVERLRAELRHPRWQGELVAMGTNTDPYQRAEGRYHLTQGLIGVLSEARNPFSVLTKSPLVLRDLDLLARAARRTTVDVNLSIGTLDADVWRLTEPGAPHPRRRVTAVAPAQRRRRGLRCADGPGAARPVGRPGAAGRDRRRRRRRRRPVGLGDLPAPARPAARARAGLGRRGATGAGRAVATALRPPRRTCRHRCRRSSAPGWSSWPPRPGTGTHRRPRPYDRRRRCPLRSSRRRQPPPPAPSSSSSVGRRRRRAPAVGDVPLVRQGCSSSVRPATASAARLAPSRS